jgi:NAD+ kinase
MKNIALYESSGKPEAIRYAEQTARKLKDCGVNVYCRCALAETFSNEMRSYVRTCDDANFEKSADVVISFGGDGTMLGAAREMIDSNVPIMGFNVGRLGFLAEFSVKDIDKNIDDLLKGNYRVVDRAVLETVLDGETIYALNDFVIEKKDISRMITIDAYSNKHLIGHIRADGIIITTPTGSTAYSLSCGGPILAPSTEVLCITPISPHSLTLRPLVIPDKNEMTMKVFSPSGEAILVADGQVKRILNNAETVIIKKSEARIKLIKPLESSYYDLLREKLLWGANYEDKNKLDGLEQ